MFKLSFALTLFASLAAVNAQATVPDVTDLPATCATNCAGLIELGTLCSNQYQDVTALGACFCSDLPSASDLSSCSTCLTSSGAGDLGNSLTMLTSMCSTATKACAFQCDFPTCGAKDIECQCGEEYLQNIFNCASCNSANGNNDATTLKNYNELKDSCVLQNYTSIPTATQALPSPTGQGSYVAPTLTNSEGASASAGSSTAVRSGIVVSSSTIPVSASSGAAQSISSIASSLRASASASGSASRTNASATASGVPASSTSTAGNSAVKNGASLGGLMVLVGLAGLI